MAFRPVFVLLGDHMSLVQFFAYAYRFNLRGFGFRFWLSLQLGWCTPRSWGVQPMTGLIAR